MDNENFLQYYFSHLGVCMSKPITPVYSGKLDFNKRNDLDMSTLEVGHYFLNTAECLLPDNQKLFAGNYVVCVGFSVVPGILQDVDNAREREAIWKVVS